MGRLSTRKLTLTIFILITNLLAIGAGQTLSISSSSTFVGDTSTNYTFQITSLPSASAVTITFNSWSNLTAAPYSSSTKCYISGIVRSYTPLPSNQIQFAATLSGTFNITLSAMTNPSSSKPYPISLSFTLLNSSSLTISASLTVTALLNYPLSLLAYTRTIGTTSSSVSIDIVMNNYIDSTTILSLTYNSAIISITFANTSAYTVLQNTNGTALISNWNSLSSLNGKITLTSITITNPPAAISYTITGSFYFKQANITYNIQTVSTSVSLSATSFSTFSIASPLPYGALSALAVTSACSFTQVSSGNASNPAYTTVDFPTDLQPANSSCVATSNSSCQHTKSGNYSLDNFQMRVGNFSTVSLTFTSYTYYANAYYPLCKGTASVSLTQQSTTPSIIATECDSNVTSLSNTINIYTSLQSVAAGDILSISGIRAVITNTNVWSQTTISNTTWYSFTLASSNIVVNGTIRSVTLPLIYNNPNQTVANSISQLTISRSGLTYASMQSTTLTLCTVSAARPIFFYSIIPSTYTTYSSLNISLGFTFQIYDYAYNDYLSLQIASTGLARQYFLAGPLLGVTPNLTVNGVYCSFTITNDYAIKIILDKNVTLPTTSSPTLTIILLNLINPPAVDSYWFSLTTVDQPTGGTKEMLSSSSTYTLQVGKLSYTISDVYELANNSLSLVVSNPNRLILSKNNASAITNLAITLPSTLSCSNFPNGSVSATWNVGILTSSSYTSGTTTNLTINLGTCFVFYFSNTTSFTASESFGGSQSTSTAISVKNKCGSCYQCNNANSACSSCFNSTYTTSTFYYNGQCSTSCPSSAYTSNGSCFTCHSSCLTCVGPLFTNCTACSQNFVLSSGYCGSVCGSGKYQSNGNCLSCHPNCQSCLSYTVCYVCKTNAVMIGTQCQFTTCTSPCLSCFGSMNTCTSCISGLSLYESQCYSSCPSDTFKSENVCVSVSESSTYVPVTITGAVLFALLVVLRAYASKKIGNQSRRRKDYQQEQAQINYKINLLRVASVLFSYLQLVAALVILIKNNTYSIGSNSVLAIIIGLIFHLLCNIAFLIAYLRMAHLKKIENDANAEEEQSDTSLRHKAIIILSAIFTLRTYKLLQANLFIDRTPPYRPRQGIPSRKLIRSNSLGDEQLEANIQPTTSAIIVPKQEGRFMHPFLTYLTLIDLSMGTLPVLIGAILQLLGALFPQMLLWGLDCLLVGVASLALTAWDLWVFANLRPSEQNSEMSSRQEANNTHENLKQLTDFDIKIEPDKTSPKKPTARGKLSQRTQKGKEKEELSMEGVRGGIKRECDEETVAREEALPHLKVFQDFDQKDENILNEKKTKKFSTKNLRRDKKLSSRRNLPSQRRNPLGEVCDDLYINFAANDRTHAPTNFHSRASPNRSLQEESIQVGGQFEDQPPNFADISDIEQGMPEPINISLSSDPQHQN